MLDLKVIAIFVRVAERRSFAQAARALGITQSGVSNAVSRLEQRLGVRLLARTTRQVNLTEDGTAFLERCRRILADLEEAESVLGQARLTPSGWLRVSLSESFGRLKIVPLLGEFRDRYPDVSLALSFADRLVDLVDEGVDVAIRLGTLQDSSLVARRLTRSQFRVYGAPAYFAKHGRPTVPEDLKHHNCLGFTFRDTRVVREWRFRRKGADMTITPRGDMTFSDGSAIRIAAAAGYGLVQMRDYYAEDLSSDGLLESVLDRYAPTTDPISLVYPSARHLSPKVRAFADFMIAKFR